MTETMKKAGATVDKGHMIETEEDTLLLEANL